MALQIQNMILLIFYHKIHFYMIVKNYKTTF